MGEQLHPPGCSFNFPCLLIPTTWPHSESSKVSTISLDWINPQVVKVEKYLSHSDAAGCLSHLICRNFNLARCHMYDNVGYDTMMVHSFRCQTFLKVPGYQTLVQVKETPLTRYCCFPFTFRAAFAKMCVSEIAFWP